MAQRQRGELFTARKEEWISEDDEGTYSQFGKVFEDRLNLAFGAGMPDMQQATGIGCAAPVLLQSLLSRKAGWLSSEGQDTRDVLAVRAAAW